MKYLIASAIMLASTMTALAQISIRPQLGYNSSRFTKSYQDLEFGTEAGFQFGVDVQIGNKFYIQPGLMWESAQNELQDMIDGDNTSIEINRIRVPLMLGYRLVGAKEGGLLDARIYTGPNASFAVNKDLKSTSLVKKEDFQDAIYGWNAGIGLDIAIVFVDLGYSFGLNEVFEGMASGARNNLFYINAGIRLGF